MFTKHVKRCYRPGHLLLPIVIKREFSSLRSIWQMQNSSINMNIQMSLSAKSQIANKYFDFCFLMSRAIVNRAGHVCLYFFGRAGLDTI